jgi:hypothetical protein
VTSSSRHHRPTCNRLVALLVAAALAAGCSGSAPPGAQSPPPTTPRADGLGLEPAAGQVLDVGATTVARSPSGRVRLATLSSRAGLVTGGDVLVEVRVDGSGDDSAAPALAVDDHPVGDLGAPDSRGRRRHLVTGLPARATISASVGGDPGDRAQLTVEDHPRNGPLFAGPKLDPFVCKNETLGLARASDADCSAPAVYTWRYRGQDNAWHDLPDPGGVPADAATATVAGRTVPFVVREEKGVIGRSIYTVAVLDPSPAPAGAPAPTADGAPVGAPPWRPDGWNGRLVHRYGGGCGSTYSNNAGGTPAAASPELLSRGYAVISSTLNTFQALCNTVVSAEVTALLREHFVEHYGVPDHVIGDGGSGGAIQQLQIVQNYPGLLDAVTPTQTFPDSVSISGGVTDCGLMVAYRDTPEGAALTDAQWSAVSGFANFATCVLWKRSFLETINPTDGCDPALADQVYQPVERPRGVRCTGQDSNINTVGRDPDTGFARRPLDNTGIEYGLTALQNGTITAEQFLDLNERIGGYDIDGQLTPARMAADDETIGRAYRSGGVTGTDPRPLADVPILFGNTYTDAQGDIHDLFRAFSLRDRFKAAGVPGNTALWAETRRAPSAEPTAVLVADEWLTRAAASPADRPWAERLAATRPDAAVDTCRIDQEPLRGDHVFDEGPCHDTFVPHGDPRVAAGAPLRNDILKCTRRPVDDTVVEALRVALSAEQRARLGRIFADGVCDWTKPAQGAVSWAGPWQRY